MGSFFLCVFSYKYIIKTVDFIVPLFLFAVWLILVFHIIDVILWETRGIESIVIKNNKLIITKTKRLFRRKKRIRLKNIHKLILYCEKNLFRKFMSCMSVDFSICIKYRFFRRYYFGRYLSDEEANDLLQMIQNEVDKYNEENKKSVIL
jgi:hypothetical protein